MVSRTEPEVSNHDGHRRHPFNEEVQYEAQVDRLRHSKFVGLREDKNPRSAVKEQTGEP
jgi:hypothetical protein